VVAFASGSGAGSGGPTTATAFIGPTVNVTVATGQRVHVVVDQSLGSTVAGGGTALNLYPCFQSTVVGSSITTQGGGMFALTVPQGQRQLFGINAVFTGFPTGTWRVGMCGSSANAASWNNNEWGYITALVFQ